MSYPQGYPFVGGAQGSFTAMWMLCALGGALLVLWALALVYRDVTERRLPDGLTLPPGVVGVLTVGMFSPQVALAGLAWPGLYVVLGTWRGGIGGGDIKLAFSLGTATAAVGGLAGVLGAVLLASVITGAGLVACRSTTWPHGPSMLLAALLSITWAVAGH